MKRLMLLLAPVLLSAALTGCGGNAAYEPPPESIPTIPPGRSAGDGPAGGAPGGTGATQGPAAPSK